MKRILLILLFGVIAGPLWSQSVQTYGWDADSGSWVYKGNYTGHPATVTDYNGAIYVDGTTNNNYYFNVPVVNAEPPVLPKHEVGFAVSADGDGWVSGNNHFNHSQYYEQFQGDYASPWDAIRANEIFSRGERESWLMSLGYFYRPAPHLQVGGYFAFKYWEQRYFNTINRTLHNTLSDYFWAISPTIRFNLVEQEFFRLYMQGGFSVAYIVRQARFGQSRSKTAFDWEWTLLGLSVGNKLFVNAEFGKSAGGYVKLGMGFRF